MRARGGRLAALVLAHALLAAPHAARGDRAAVGADLSASTEGSPSGATDSHEYRSVIDEALKAYAAERYDEARALFLRAHAILPTARTHRGIGLAEHRLGHYATCVTALEAALASRERPLTGQVRAATEELLEEAQRRAGRLLVTRAPAHAQFSVDRVARELAPGEPLWLDEGEHRVEARAAGFVPIARTVRVTAGAELAIDLTLAPLRPEASAPAGPALVLSAAPTGTADRAPIARRRWYASPWLWASVGVVAAGLGAGLGVALAGGSGSERQSAYGGSTGRALDGP